MRKWAVAILSLTLISFQIAMTFADGPSGAIDRSTTYDVVIVPRSGPPIVLKTQYGQWVGDINIYDYLKNDSQLTPLTSNPPNTYYLYPSVTFTEGKNTYQTLYTFSCDGVGQYDLRATITATNPSNKWREVFFAFQFLGTPNNFVTSWGNHLAPKVYINRGVTAPNIPFAVIFTTGSTGTLQCVVEGHSIITDVNNDKIVNILDVAAVAKQYGKILSGRSDSNYLYDMDCNLVIDIVDVTLVSLDYGFHVPP